MIRAVLSTCVFLIISNQHFIEIHADSWKELKKESYTLYYRNSDVQHLEEYLNYFEPGRNAVEDFFHSNFKYSFDIYIHPDRESLDSAWQTDWGMPEFKSQCWMVASGVAARLDIISPRRWDSIACEHSASDSIKTKRLITHEMVHVFHGQHNFSPDFSDISGLDWFVEGLAVYASGQCDSARIEAVKNALSKGLDPGSLDEFFTGELRYGLAGSLIMYLDDTYGRDAICNLLEYNREEELLNHLETTEEEIVDRWKLYMSDITRK